MLKTVGFPSTRTGDQTIVNGNLVIGTAGKGIDFSADPSAPGMTSELLDDYEEGTWTPTTNGDATGAFSAAAGVYRKVGSIVVATAFIIVSADFTSGRIGGLPFVCTSGFGGTGSNFSNAVLPFASAVPLYITVDGNATTAQFSQNGYSTQHIPNTTTLAYKLTMVYATA